MRIRRSRARPTTSLFLAMWFLTAACAPATTTEPTMPEGTPEARASDPPPIRLLIDSDLAADDIVAIASLLREPAVEVVGITVAGTGEAHCPGGLYSARALVTALSHSPVPVACGRESAIGEAEAFPPDWRIGADDGYGIRLPHPAMPPDVRSAEQLIVDLSRAGDTKLTILTIGPLTNIAMALRLDPALPSRIDRVVSMAGAIDVPGNVSPQDDGSEAPTAEWNLHADPTAAAEVFAAGLDLTLVPLDATNDVPLDTDFVAALEMDHAAAPADIVFELYARNSFLVTGEPMLWDSIAAVSLVHPEVVTMRDAAIRVVEGNGLDGGQTVEDAGGWPVVIGIGTDPALFRDLLFASLRRGDARAHAFTPTLTIHVHLGTAACEATLDPVGPRAGVVRLQATGIPDTQAGAVVFALGDVTWDAIVAFAANPVFDETAPEIKTVAQLSMEPGASGTAYGEATAGLIGVACLTGTFGGAPVIHVVGPFELRP